MRKIVFLVVLALLGGNSLCLSVVQSEFFVVKDMGCTHFKSPSHRIVCYPLDSPEKVVLDEKEEDFKKAYPNVFQFSEKQEIVPKGQAKWIHKGFSYKTKVGESEIELNEEQFSSIYFDFKLLKGKGPLKNYALCKADHETYSIFTC